MLDLFNKYFFGSGFYFILQRATSCTFERGFDQQLPTNRMFRDAFRFVFFSSPPLLFYAMGF